MRVLLLHPDDRERSGPWFAQSWDLVVNLGRSHSFPTDKLSSGSRVLHLDSYKRGLADAHLVRALLRAGRGWLIDHEGIDWWELTSVAIVQQAFVVILLQRLAGEIPRPAEVWCTRPDWASSVLAHLFDAPLRSFPPSTSARLAGFARHYGEVLHQFSPVQIRQILFDKYDAAYRWRSRFSARKKPCSAPVVLIPSAYSNVSGMAAGYAAMLPEMSFLLVATRQSAHDFVRSKNVEVRELSAYAQVQPKPSELASLMENWQKLKSHLHSWEALRLLSSAGVLDQFSGLFESGLFVRDAWRQILEREPICSVLCGDDSNIYTRLPVLLAAKRNLPTVDFHHGALDGFYLLKDLPCDLYLAKSEMELDFLLRVCELPPEKVVIAPPASPQRARSRAGEGNGRSVVLFSEPYEVGGLRADDVYGEILPSLWRLAHENGRDLVIKLHPFESRSRRSRIVGRVLPTEASRRVQWVEGPLTRELFEKAWFGITIESTTAIECTRNGVCCFLCRWLTLSPWEYAEQFARFGMGESLGRPEDIREIPARLKEFHNRSRNETRSETFDPAQLQQWLTSGHQGEVQARSAS